MDFLFIWYKQIPWRKQKESFLKKIEIVTIGFISSNYMLKLKSAKTKFLSMKFINIFKILLRYKSLLDNTVM